MQCCYVKNKQDFKNRRTVQCQIYKLIGHTSWLTGPYEIVVLYIPSCSQCVPFPMSEPTSKSKSNLLNHSSCLYIFHLAVALNTQHNLFSGKLSHGSLNFLFHTKMWDSLAFYITFHVMV